MKGYLICLSGVDGSGKTSAARRLEIMLRERGIASHYVWLRRARFICLPFLAMCYILGYARTAYAPDGTRTGVYEFYKSEWLSYLWAWFTGIDMLVSSLFRIYLPLARGKVLIVDRYVADAYVDLLCDTSIRNNGNRSLRFLLRLLPQESELLFLDVEEQEAVRRKTDILDRECLTARRKIYAELAVRLDGYRIDTTHISLQTVCEEIIKVLDWGTTS